MGAEGTEALQALAEVMAELAKEVPTFPRTVDRARDALRLSKEGVDWTAEGIRNLEALLNDGKKTNQTLLEMLRKRHAWATSLRETVRSTLQSTQIASLLNAA